jgi:hypothetical protein
VSVDTGRELDLPRRLAEGQLLYRDARFYYGPLAPYLNALLYRIFGVHLDVLVWAGIASAALMVAGLYRMARFFLPRWASTTIAVVFIYLCGFAHIDLAPIFNFVLPYTFAATYGIVAATWSAVFLIGHMRLGSRAAFLASVACLALAALSKIEALVPAAAAHVVFVASLLVTRRRQRVVYVAGYAGAAVVVFLVYGGLWLSVGPMLWRENLFGVVNAGSEKFVLLVMGLLNLKASLEALALSIAMMAAMLLTGLLLSRLLRHRGTRDVLGWAAVAAAAVAAFLAYRSWQLHVHFRFLPVAMLVSIVVLGVLFVRRPERRPEWATHLVLWTFAFASIWRIVLNARPHHYGFYLLPAGLVGTGVLLFNYLPRAAGLGHWPTRVFAALGLGMLGASVSLAVADSHEFYALHRYEMSTPRGHLRIVNRWQLEGPAIEALAHLPPETRVATIPQGAAMPYFAGLREGDSMFSYLPMEVATPEMDRQLCFRLRSNPPDIIAWVGIPMEEFGSRGFGYDYALETMAWIRGEYVPVTQPMAAVVFMERKKNVAAGVPLPQLVPSAELPSRPPMAARVLESYEEESETFARLATGTETIWVAMPRVHLERGATITVEGLRPGFVENHAYRRRFEHLLTGRVALPLAARGPGPEQEPR